MARLIIDETPDLAVASPVSPAVVGIVGTGTDTIAVNTPTEIINLAEAETNFGIADSIYRAAAGVFHAGASVRLICIRYADADTSGTPLVGTALTDNIVAAIRLMRTAAITGGHKPDLILAAGENQSETAAELTSTTAQIRARGVISGTHADVAESIAWQQTAGNTGPRLLKCWPNPVVPGIAGDNYAEAVVAGFWALYETLPNGRAITPAGRDLDGVLPGSIEVEYSTDPTSDMSLMAAADMMVIATGPTSMETYGGKFSGDTVLSHLAPRTVADYIYTDLDAVQRAYTKRPGTRANGYHIDALGGRLQGRLRSFAQPLGSGLIEGGSVAVDNAYNNVAANLAASRIAYDITLVMPRAWGDITFRVISTF